MGITDSGKPFHLVIFISDKTFGFNKIHLPKKNTILINNFNKIHLPKKNTILINNGIHPSEPDGIDASMLLLRDIVQSKSLKKRFENVIICIIPIYNRNA